MKHTIRFYCEGFLLPAVVKGIPRCLQHTLGLRNVTYVVGCAAVELAGVAIQLDSYGVVAGMVRGRRDFFSSELRLIR